MKKTFLLGAAAFVLVTAAYFAMSSAGGSPPDAPVFYHYNLRQAGIAKAADLLSVFLAYLFVFFTSLLFFGVGTPLALGLEAAKYAQLALRQGMHYYDYLFAAPAFIAAYAATLLSEGLLEDYEHRGIVFKNLEVSVVLFLTGLALMLALFFARGVLVK